MNDSDRDVNELPTPQQLWMCFKEPESDPRVAAFLEANPLYREFMERVMQLDEEAARRVEARAGQIYEERVSAGKPGDEKSDWFQAEAALCSELEALNKAYLGDGKKETVGAA